MRGLRGILGNRNNYTVLIEAMRYFSPYAKRVVVSLSVAATLAGVWSVAAVGDNPYKDIITRNAFNLKPPEQPKPPEPPVEEKGPSNIVMTGVTSIGGKKQVFLTVTIPGEKDPKYLRLGENERDGAIEIVSIDPKTSRVRIKNSGVSSVISFETHGAKQMMAAAAPTRPGVPGVPGGPIGSDRKSVV